MAAGSLNELKSTIDQASGTANFTPWPAVATHLWPAGRSATGARDAVALGVASVTIGDTTMPVGVSDAAGRFSPQPVSSTDAASAVAARAAAVRVRGKDRTAQPSTRWTERVQNASTRPASSACRFGRRMARFT